MTKEYCDNFECNNIAKCKCTDCDTYYCKYCLTPHPTTKLLLCSTCICEYYVDKCSICHREFTDSILTTTQNPVAFCKPCSKKIKMWEKSGKPIGKAKPIKKIDSDSDDPLPE